MGAGEHGSARIWRLAHGRELVLGRRALVMGILNVTPDSFSDGGLYRDPALAVEHAHAMARAGADLIDIGGESTRPGAVKVEPAEEQARILPVIATLAASLALPISVDTSHAATARLALARGAHIVNDVTGLQGDPEMAGIVAGSGAGIIIMHSGRGRARLPDPIDDQLAYLGRSLEIARAAGIADDRIVLDPGFGFAKEGTAENLALLHRFGELAALGFPLMAGVSRKRFVGAVTGQTGDPSGGGTAALSVLLRLSGADIFRVHDVAINRDALAVADAIRMSLP